MYFKTSPSKRGFENRARYHPGHISIPAPPRGASFPTATEMKTKMDFNTSPSTRGFDVADECISIDAISIPAPPRGASSYSEGRETARIFQYQPLHEGLPIATPVYSGSASFQYQPLHEGLQTTKRRKRMVTDFNTSPSTRGFSIYLARHVESAISIPAPPRGASGRYRQTRSRKYFNTSPSTRGFTQGLSEQLKTRFQYQPLHEGLR